MEQLNSRFKQEGGSVYKEMNVSEQVGGRKSNKLSPKSENWKKKYLILKLERDNLKKENESLKKKLDKQ
jgi:hypothetical protein